MKGLRIDDATEFPSRFAKAFGPVLDAFAGHYWYIDGYGPFGITDKPNFRELDAQLDQYSVHVEGMEDGPPGLWRPGLLPWAADFLVVDEGTTLVGIVGNESYAGGVAAELDKAIQTSAKIIELVDENKIDIALIYIDGWWEVIQATRS